MDEANKKEAAAVKEIKPRVQQIPAKTHPTMREAIIWAEIIAPPLSKRKRSKPYTAVK